MLLMNKKLFLFLNFILNVTFLFADPPNWDESGDGIYPMTVQIIGKGSLYDPKNERVRI